jgi:hypothetical protein
LAREHTVTLWVNLCVSKSERSASDDRQVTRIAVQPQRNEGVVLRRNGAPEAALDAVKANDREPPSMHHAMGGQADRDLDAVKANGREPPSNAPEGGRIGRQVEGNGRGYEDGA